MNNKNLKGKHVKSDDINVKFCHSCEEFYNKNMFHKNNSRIDKLEPYCKNCANKKMKIWRSKNKDRVSNNNKKNYYSREYVYSWSRNVMNAHRCNGYKLQFTIDQLKELAKITNRCDICGVNLIWESFGRNRPDNHPSMDNVNLKKELTINDVMIICNSCNTTKNKRTLHEFIDYCDKVLKRHKEKVSNGI